MYKTGKYRPWRRVLLFSLLLGLAAGAGAAKKLGYHLTGVMASSNGKAFAVIETANGQQRLLNVGDQIDNGRVVAISAQDKTVSLLFPDGEIELGLHGSGKKGKAGKQEREPYSTEDYSEVEQQQLSPTQLADLIGLITTADKLAEKESRLRLNTALGFSADARVVAYNRRPVKSSRQLLRMLGRKAPEKMLSGAHLGSVSVSDEQGEKRIYLSVASVPDGS